MIVAALLMAGVLSGGEPDGVVTTAPATTVDLEATVQPTASAVEGAAQAAVPHGLSTDEQIDRWIAARSPANTPFADGEARAEAADDRKMHGEVTVAVGTGDYREYGAAVSLPIGETGRLDLSYREIHKGYGLGRYGYGHGYGDPYYLDDGGYAFPGYQPGAATEFEWRARRPGGPPRSRPLIEPRRQTPD
jgi:hypothetical protein